jgi:hypothetical protein
VTLFFHHLKLLSRLQAAFASGFPHAHMRVICFIENEKFLVSLIYDSLMSSRKKEKNLRRRERKFYRSGGDLLAHFGVARRTMRTNEPTSAFLLALCAAQPVGLSSSYLLY